MLTNLCHRRKRWERDLAAGILGVNGEAAFRMTGKKADRCVQLCADRFAPIAVIDDGSALKADELVTD